MSAEMSGNKDREWTVASKILGWSCTCMWGPVVVVLDEWSLPRESQNSQTLLSVLQNYWPPVQWEERS